MRLTITPTLLLVAAFVLIVWFLRHEQVSRTLGGVTCVEQVNRYTKERCLLTDDEPRCRDLISSRPCSQ